MNPLALAFTVGVQSRYNGNEGAGFREGFSSDRSPWDASVAEEGIELIALGAGPGRKVSARIPHQRKGQ